MGSALPLITSGWTIAHEDKNLPRGVNILERRNNAAFRAQLLILRQGGQDIGLPQAQRNLLILIFVGHDEIFNLQ